MAKIILENTREHDITIFATGEDGVVQVTVPGARQDPADKNKLVHGRAEADDAFITAVVWSTSGLYGNASITSRARWVSARMMTALAPWKGIR